MTKKDYLDQLEKGLGSMSYSDVKEILAEIDEHFCEGLGKGKTEDDICSELGSPVDLAKAYMEGTPLPKALVKAAEPKAEAPKSTSDTGGILFVILFNLIIGLPVWLSLLAFIMGLVSVEIAMIFGLVAVAAACATLGTFLASGILFALVLFFLTVVLTVICYFSIKYFFIGTVKYFKWNCKVWKQGL